jgi:hypothetical protein
MGEDLGRKELEELIIESQKKVLIYRAKLAGGALVPYSFFILTSALCVWGFKEDPSLAVMMDMGVNAGACLSAGRDYISVMKDYGRNIQNLSLEIKDYRRRVKSLE